MQTLPVTGLINEINSSLHLVVWSEDCGLMSKSGNRRTQTSLFYFDIMVSNILIFFYSNRYYCTLFHILFSPKVTLALHFPKSLKLYIAMWLDLASEIWAERMHIISRWKLLQPVWVGFLFSPLPNEAVYWCHLVPPAHCVRACIGSKYFSLYLFIFQCLHIKKSDIWIWCSA